MTDQKRPPSFIFTTFQRRLEQREQTARLADGFGLSGLLERQVQYLKLAKMIGNNPLLRVASVGDSNIIASVQSANPGESHYDRAYLAILKRLETDGVIEPGDELHEVTSGSSGTSFAWLCRSLGYQAHILASSDLPAARRQEMINLGATVIDSGTDYVKGSSEMQRRDIASLKRAGYAIDRIQNEDYLILAAKKGDHRVCFVNHSHLKLTVDAFEGVADQVASKLRGPQVDAMFTVLGNWTTTNAWSRRFRHFYPDIKVVGIEDSRSPVYAAQLHPTRFNAPPAPSKDFVIPPDFTYGSSMAGIPLAFDDIRLLDDIAVIKPTERDAELERWNHGRPVVETIGRSSAASLVAARRFAAENPGSTSLVFFYDRYDRYLEPVTDSKDGPTAVRERCSISFAHGGQQQPVKSVADLPESLIDVSAGGLGRVFQSWALA